MNNPASPTPPRRALVTGATRGIGRAVALALAAEGHETWVNYRGDRERAEALCAEIATQGGRAHPIAFDVRDGDATRAALDTLLEGGAISIVVNNAGISRDAAFPSLSREDWDEVTRTTLDGFFNVTQPLVMPMVRQKWGRIINVSSISGVMGNRGQVNYAAAKAGLIGATKALSLELAKRKITVNAVAPGPIDTDMLDDAPRDQILAHVPARRLGTPEEVADLVAFLASDKAAYISGQVIGISGGLG